ncbi:hypothetical protein PMNALOAF_1051 [Methylobacterium adhaesivum]|jgi:disulfide bond formation protein DsbB|uniref:Uncharacterized protein n=1 Tax=Methylobacterium adhaesivum TaxID=333297 RepID=A0ABT8BHD2_9HYPH|nr:hypothetical protein [Methylobacterium adhaesivum]MDN3590801.1 hypothetical protein [Methylobacterium adhaesivum]GJD29811.1 hypothetical protein PMNALOAF_1051 [Methylobacterium adhaesivum]
MDVNGQRAVTARDWDARVARLTEKMPASLAKALAWLREPSRRIVRIAAALLFILGGVFSILPVLGLWMLPVGLALLSEDIPGLKVPLERSARWIVATWERVTARFRRRGPGA